MLPTTHFYWLRCAFLYKGMRLNIFKLAMNLLFQANGSPPVNT